MNAVTGIAGNLLNDAKLDGGKLLENGLDKLLDNDDKKNGEKKINDSKENEKKVTDKKDGDGNILDNVKDKIVEVVKDNKDEIIKTICSKMGLTVSFFLSKKVLEADTYEFERLNKESR